MELRYLRDGSVVFGRQSDVIIVKKGCLEKRILQSRQSVCSVAVLSCVDGNKEFRCDGSLRKTLKNVCEKKRLFHEKQGNKDRFVKKLFRIKLKITRNMLKTTRRVEETVL